MVDTIVSRRDVISTVGLGGTIALSGCLGGGDGEDGGGGDGGATDGGSGIQSRELRIGAFLPDTHPFWVDMVDPLMEQVEEETDGQITFEKFPGAQLADAGEHLPLVQDGTLDGAWLGNTHWTDVIPRASVGDLPGTAETVRQGKEAFLKLLRNELFELELRDANLFPVQSGYNGPYPVWTVEDVGQLHAPEDWEDLNIRSSGGHFSWTYENFGANPVELAITDSLRALQEGTIDGLPNSTTTLDTYDLHEPLYWGTDNVNMGTVSSAVYYNLDTWNSLSGDAQEIMLELGTQTSAEFGDILAQQQLDLTEQHVDAGNLETYSVSEEYLPEVDAILAETRERWASEVDNGDELVEAWNQYLEETPTDDHVRSFPTD